MTELAITVCDVCGALVAPTMTEYHLNWHRTMTNRPSVVMTTMVEGDEQL